MESVFLLRLRPYLVPFSTLVVCVLLLMSTLLFYFQFNLFMAYIESPLIDKCINTTYLLFLPVVYSFTLVWFNDCRSVI